MIIIGILLVEAYITRLNRSWKNGCEDLVQIMISIAVAAPILPTIHFVANPWHPFYFTHYLVSQNVQVETGFPSISLLQAAVEKYGLVWVSIALVSFALFQIIMVWIICSAILFIIVDVTVSAFVFTCAVKEMTYDWLQYDMHQSTLVLNFNVLLNVID